MSYGVTIWAEGGRSIGMGHIMRSVNLGAALRDIHVPVTFLVNDEAPVKLVLREKGFDYRISPITEDVLLWPVTDVVVLDTKKDVSALIELLRGDGKTVVLLDNTTDAAGAADMVVVPSPFFNTDSVGNVIGGPGYMIIGENFKRARGASVELKHALPLRVLVTMGGADPNRLTEKIVEALWDVDDIEATVIIGPAFPKTRKLAGLKRRKDRRFTFLEGVKDLGPLMASAHIAFTAVGTTINELAYMGVPSIIISNYVDDAPDLVELEMLGIALPLGYHAEVVPADIRDAVERFVEDSEYWEEMKYRAASLTDGHGARKVAEIIAVLLDEFGVGLRVMSGGG